MWRRFAIRLLACVPFLPIWGPGAFLALYLKHVMMEEGGYMVLYRSLGRLRPPGTAFDDMFTLQEKLTLFRSDILVATLVVPGLAVALLSFLRHRVRAPFMAVVTLALMLVMYAQIIALKSVGTLLSFQSMKDAVEWGLAHPGEGATHVTPSGALKFVVLAAAVVVAAVVAGRLASSQRTARLRQGIMGVIAASLTVVVALAAAPGVAIGPYQASALGRSLCTFSGHWLAASRELTSAPWPDLMSEYRRLARVPGATERSVFWGRAAGFDVILLIFETLPARSLDLLGSEGSLPNLRRLSARSWVASRHHSTFCWTSSAIFSILSSWYPSALTLDPRVARGPVPGLARSLRENGYGTHVYLPEGSAVARDLPMYRDLGVTTITSVPVPPVGASPGQALWDRTLAGDRATLQRLKLDLAVRIEERQRYFAVFLPQTGHALEPGEDLASQSSATLSQLDGFVGEILDLLEEKGVSGRTVVLATGDHGFRTRHEDPSLQGGMVDDVSYHVPLTVYAPGVLGSAEVIPWITSHIDIAPTVLDLLGIDTGRALEQGSAVWDQRLGDRITFFWGAPYLGADGYHDRGRFYMWQYLGDAVFRNSVLHFTGVSPVEAESVAAQDAKRLIARMSELQHAWLSKDFASEAVSSETGSRLPEGLSHLRSEATLKAGGARTP